MKKYIICDEYSDYKNASDYNDLKEILIDEIKRDTVENYTEKEIVVSNFEIMKKLALEKKENIDYLKEQLMGFGYYIMDLTSLQNDLNNYQAFKSGVGCPFPRYDCIEKVLEMIDKDMR